jgi:hypothetical protein
VTKIGKARSVTEDKEEKAVYALLEQEYRYARGIYLHTYAQIQDDLEISTWGNSDQLFAS